MRGILYYPPKNEDKIVEQNMQDLGISARELTSTTASGKWDEIKKEFYGDENFIIGNKNMFESCRDTIEKIKRNEIKIEDFMYNPFKLYELINDYSYASTTYKKVSKETGKKLDVNILIKFVEKVAKAGANIEEVKMLVLASLFFNVDTRLDRVHEDRDILESKMFSSVRLIKSLNWLELMSPYESVFIASKVFMDTVKENETGKLEFVEYCRLFDQCDPYILGYIAKCKMKSYFLLSALRLRYLTDMDESMKNPLVRKIYEIRKPYENNMEKAYGVFKYSIRDDFKDLMASIMRDEDKIEMKKLADEFFYYGLVDKREYDKYYAAGQVEFTYEEETGRDSGGDEIQ